MSLKQIFLKKNLKKDILKFFFIFKKKILHYVFEENWRPIPVANNGQHLPTVLSCPEDEFCLGNCRKSGFSCFSNTEGLMAQCWVRSWGPNQVILFNQKVLSLPRCQPLTWKLENFFRKRSHLGADTLIWEFMGALRLDQPGWGPEGPIRPYCSTKKYLLSNLTNLAL